MVHLSFCDANLMASLLHEVGGFHWATSFVRNDYISWEISSRKCRYCSRFVESHIESIDREIGISFPGGVKLRCRCNPWPAPVPSILRISSRLPARRRSSDDRSLDSQRSAEKKIKFPFIQFRCITYQTKFVIVFFACSTCIMTYFNILWCIIIHYNVQYNVVL